MAQDKYGYEVSKTVQTTVTLKQVRACNVGTELYLVAHNSRNCSFLARELAMHAHGHVQCCAALKIANPADSDILLLFFHRTQVGSVRIDVTLTYAIESPGVAAATTDYVRYDYAVVNNGLLSLFDISISDSVLEAHGTAITCTDVDGTTVDGSMAGVLNGLASYPNNGLAPVGQLTCTATDMVSQDEVLFDVSKHISRRDFGCKRVQQCMHAHACIEKRWV